MPTPLRLTGHASRPSKPMKFPFTKAKLEALAPGERRREVHDSKVPGLSLRITPTGKKTFTCRRWVDGGPVRVTIGPFPTVTIEQARQSATKLAAQLLNGENPNAEKRRRRQAQTVGQAWAAYLSDKEATRKETTAKAEASLWKNLAKLEPRKLADVNAAELRALHAEIGKRGEPTANRTIQLLRRVYNYAAKLHDYTGPIPTAGVTFFKESSRERFLTPAEVAAFFASAREEGDPWAGFFAMALFTGARRANIQAMNWADIDLDAKTWTIDRGEAKAAKTIVLPLTPEAIATLERLRPNANEAGWVFPGRGKTRSGHVGNAKRPMDRILKRAGMEHCTIHDLRRTAGSHLVANGVPLPIVAKMLGHSDLRATAIYARLDVGALREALDASTARMAGGTTES